jgi:hypothetical protein
VQPFIGEDSVLALAFPPKELATTVPVYAGVVLLSIILFNIGWSLVSAHPVFQGHKNEDWDKKQT